MVITGYCVKCKKKVEIQNPIKSLTKRDTKMAKGKCPICGTTVCRLGEIKDENDSKENKEEENKND